MRALTPEVIAALEADTVSLALLFEGAFDGGTIRLWTGLGDLSWNGETWVGMGDLLAVSAVEDTDQVVAGSVAVSLSGVPADLVQTAIDEAQQGLPGQMWLAVLDSDGAVIPDPISMFAGRLDVPEIAEDEQTCTISISYADMLVDLTRTREWRYTSQSQRQLYPGDAGLDFVTWIQERELRWGRD